MGQTEDDNEDDNDRARRGDYDTRGSSSIVTSPGDSKAPPAPSHPPPGCDGAHICPAPGTPSPVCVGEVPRLVVC